MRNLVSIDNGGTFTDICLVREGRIFHGKSLTTPYDLATCFFEALKEGSRAAYGGEDLPRLLHETDYLRYSTTAGTNGRRPGHRPVSGAGGSARLGRRTPSSARVGAQTA